VADRAINGEIEAVKKIKNKKAKEILILQFLRQRLNAVKNVLKKLLTKYRLKIYSKLHWLQPML